MSVFTRGFQGRRRDDDGRLPPGQYLTDDFPVLSAGHMPGQHVDVRLTAQDGYQTARSYSLAAPADGTRLEITVQRTSGGEVSPFLSDELGVGDRVEVRGPLGGW